MDICLNRSTYLSNTISGKTFRLGNYPSYKVVSGRPTCRFSFRTKISMFSCIKSIPIHISLHWHHNHHKHHVPMAKEMLQYYSYMKILMNSINTAYKQIWKAKMLLRNTKHTRTTKDFKI